MGIIEMESAASKSTTGIPHFQSWHYTTQFLKYGDVCKQAIYLQSVIAC